MHVLYKIAKVVATTKALCHRFIVCTRKYTLPPGEDQTGTRSMYVQGPKTDIVQQIIHHALPKDSQSNHATHPPSLPTHKGNGNFLTVASISCATS